MPEYICKNNVWAERSACGNKHNQWGNNESVKSDMIGCILVNSLLSRHDKLSYLRMILRNVFDLKT